MSRKAKANEILLQDFNQGGLAHSIFSGAANSLYKITGVDFHSIAGVGVAHQKLTQVTPATGVPNELCKVQIATSVGNTLHMSSESGKIWECTSAGVWRLVHTLTPAAGQAKILGGCEYNGYIYMFTQSRVHRITSVNCDNNNWATDCVEDWATFTNADIAFHPCVEVNMVLYIGDGKYVAQVDNATFSANALDVPSQYRVTSLGIYGTDLLIGTYISDVVSKCMFYRWNTYSDSFSGAGTDEIPEVGVWAFIPVDNGVVVYAGYQGNIYYYDGYQVKPYLKVSGQYSKTAQAKVHFGATANMSGQVLFGMSKIAGSPCDMGVYMLGRYSADYPTILTLAFPLSRRSGSTFVLNNIEIGSILLAGSDLYVSWKDTNPTTVSGMDKLDWSNKLDGAFIESRVMKVDRLEDLTFGRFSAPYFLLPAETEIKVWYKVNYAADYVEVTSVLGMKSDLVRSIKQADVGIPAVTLQIKVSLVTHDNDSPEFEEVSVLVK